MKVTLSEASAAWVRGAIDSITGDEAERASKLKLLRGVVKSASLKMIAGHGGSTAPTPQALEAALDFGLEEIERATLVTAGRGAEIECDACRERMQEGATLHAIGGELHVDIGDGEVWSF